MSNPISTLLLAMSGKTVTLGWDVVVAYNAREVNELFAQQYVANMRAGQHVPPINDTLTIGGTGVEVAFTNLTLGPPLISFAPSASAQEAIVEMNFVAGEVVVLETSGNAQYVSAYQSVVPGDQYTLRMRVQLQQIEGQVANRTVCVDLNNASTYQANLLPGTAAATYLGQYFQGLFQKETQATLTYTLGTIYFGTSENLTPVMFDVSTQVAPGSTSDGAVLLFVATKYNPHGGDLPGSEFPYLVPDGFGAAVVVASETLLANIVGPYYQNNLNGGPAVTVNPMSGTSTASCLRFTAGGADLGVVTGKNSTYPTQKYWTGKRGQYAWSSPEREDLVVPYCGPGGPGITIQPENDLLTVSWNYSISQDWTAETVPVRGEFGVTSSTVLQLTISASFKASASLLNDGVSFSPAKAGTPQACVSFEQPSWWSKVFGDGCLREQALEQIADQVKAAGNAFLQVPLPEVNAFAVSHLLFPAQNVVNFTEAHVPGDLALFGALSPPATAFRVTPLQSVMAAGQTLQLTAQGTTGTLSWTINPPTGSITQSGLYTAPPQVSGAIPVVVTASYSSGGQTFTTTAIVVVVPNAVVVSPAFTMVFPGERAQKFVASVLDGAPAATWSISPSDGSAGMIAADGTYTPPSALSSGVTLATITAASGAVTASATVALVNTMVAAMNPPYAALAPGTTQPFTPATAASYTYSVLPAGAGTVEKGKYTAPLSLPASPTALVVAEQEQGAFVGIAVVMLTPATQ